MRLRNPFFSGRLSPSVFELLRTRTPILPVAFGSAGDLFFFPYFRSHRVYPCEMPLTSESALLFNPSRLSIPTRARHVLRFFPADYLLLPLSPFLFLPDPNTITAGLSLLTNSTMFSLYSSTPGIVPSRLPPNS